MATAYEAERERRIAMNKAKLAELGVAESVDAVLATKPAKAKPAKRKAKAEDDQDAEPAEVRRSQRPRNEVSYVYKDERGEGGSRDPVDYTEKIKALQIEAEEAEKRRAELEAKRANKKERNSDKTRGPKDSGKGVRVQGGRVYDSKFGVTCHWCRQKTLEAHVTCTNAGCAKGKMPYSFCHKCLKNRHGEDAEAAAASGCWVCPACRGSCGPGCLLCCNCGPCRKKANLEPTAQIVFLARSAGFSNVHDYLVHLVTGEAEEVIADRKTKHAWGAFLREDGAAEGGFGASGSGGSDASAQTAAAGGSGDEAEEEEAAPAKAKGKGGKGRRASAGGRRNSKAAADEGSEEAAVAAGGGSSKKAAGGRGRKKAAAVEEGACDDEAEDTGAGAKAKAGLPISSPADATTGGGDQSAKMSRKARMMARMGLGGARSDAVVA